LPAWVTGYEGSRSNLGDGRAYRRASVAGAPLGPGTDPRALPEPLARSIAVTGSAGRLHPLIPVTGTQSFSLADSGTLPEPVADHGSSDPRPRARPVTGPQADPKARTES
jgi:hypothetical protein